MSDRQLQVQALNATDPVIYNWEFLACLDTDTIHDMWVIACK
ncbi:hypothetical protein Q5H92_14595 [Hymenobacter sp. M29]|uniref:Uncharacterized protein n=1 Tax=Hymenobacter mellowenesis TaxID=3063995 RepID=A0ABT9AF39_9BACT|nr:hypothetical protein [Hymenobacter sp. M29]MDO7847596.1 hypothetical protein [Hymenobacter sp. M29]